MRVITRTSATAERWERMIAMTRRFHTNELTGESKAIERTSYQSSGAPDAARYQREAIERNAARKARERAEAEVIAKAKIIDPAESENRRISRHQRAMVLLNRAARKKNGVSGRNGR